MGPQDGVDLAVRAAAHVVHELGRNDVAFTFMGGGDCYEELVALRDQLGLQDYLELPGRVPDETVLDVLSTAEVGLSPDPKNALNDLSTMNKTLEYMAFGLPVVAFDLKETRVSAGEAASYVESGDVAAYARAIVDLLDDADKREPMGKAGRRRIERGLGWPYQRDAYVGVYDALVGRSRCGADVCGVAGAFLQPDGPGLTRTMVDRISHRGPDAEGLIDMSPGTPLQLAHRRLSIIDLSAAADQPFSKDGLHLSYNGELYNYRELRDTLRGRGVRFRTDSDTEVVLECWRQWGPAGLQRLRGMFAFAIYDESTAALTLVRDPLGIKPMYVLPRGRGILFASELKALVAAVGPELAVDPAALGGVHLVLLPARRTVRHQGSLQASAGIVGRVAD